MKSFDSKNLGHVGQRWKLLRLLCLCLALPLSANGLDDLKTTLSHMQGQGTLRGSYEVNAWSRGGKGQDIEESAGTVSAWVEEDATGLQIRWDRALLKRAEAETKVKGAKKTDSAALGMGSASALHIFAAVNYAPKLAHLLSTGQLKGDRPEAYQGKPARLLEVDLKAPDSEDAKKAKENIYSVRLWIGADGLPMGAAFTRSLKVSMLLISMETSSTEDLVFAPASNRLVALRREERQTMKAMGIESQQRTLATFTPK